MRGLPFSRTASCPPRSFVDRGAADDSDAKKFIIKSKQCSAHAYAEAFGPRLWQPFGYEHVLRDDEKVQVVAKYILENPVRAGLATTVLEYSFVGSQVYDLKELLATLPERDSLNSS